MVKDTCISIKEVTDVLLYRCDQEEFFEEEVTSPIVQGIDAILQLWDTLTEEFLEKEMNERHVTSSCHSLQIQFCWLSELVNELEINGIRVNKYRSKLAMRAVHDGITDLLFEVL
jgi:hypothetical protein